MYEAFCGRHKGKTGIRSASPTLKMSQEVLTLNLAAVRHLGRPSHVLLLVDQEKGKAAIKASTSHDVNAFAVKYPGGGSGQIHARRFCRIIGVNHGPSLLIADPVSDLLTFDLPARE